MPQLVEYEVGQLPVSIRASTLDARRERPYWDELRRGSDDLYPVKPLPMFFTFEASLKGTAIETGARVKLHEDDHKGQ